MPKETIARILKTKDYYVILDVPKDCDEVVIKKSYRKLALMLHPDKCSMEGAEEAFKAVSAAYNCLSSAEQRRMYDMTGSEGNGSSGGSGGFEGFPGGQFGGVSPEEIFARFFAQQAGGMGGGFHGGFPFGDNIHFAGGSPMFFSTNMGGPGFTFQTFPMNGGGRAFRSRSPRTRAHTDNDNMNNDENSRNHATESNPLNSLPIPAPIRRILELVPVQLALPVLVIGGTLLFNIFYSIIMRNFFILALVFYATGKMKWYIIGFILFLGLFNIV